MNDVRRELTFCKKVGIPIAGIIENMSGYSCPHCKDCTYIFTKNGGKLLAERTNSKFLGKQLLKTFRKVFFPKSYNDPRSYTNRFKFD